MFSCRRLSTSAFLAWLWTWNKLPLLFKKDSRRENLRLCRNAQKEMQRLLDYKGFHAAWGLVTCNKVNEPLVSTCDILWFCVDLWVPGCSEQRPWKKMGFCYFLVVCWTLNGWNEWRQWIEHSMTETILQRQEQWCTAQPCTCVHIHVQTVRIWSYM